jgi:hypothetical protein
MEREATGCDIRQWRESLLGMFVGGDARAASNTPNGHLLIGEAAAGSGVSVNSSCQATRGDGKSICFSRWILSREAKRPRTEAHDGRDIEGDVNNSMSSVSWQGSKDIDDSRSYHDLTRGGKTRIRKTIRPFPTLTTTLTGCHWMDQQRQQSLFYMMRLGQRLLNLCHLATLKQPTAIQAWQCKSTGQCHKWCCRCDTSPQLNEHVLSCTTC